MTHLFDRGIVGDFQVDVGNQGNVGCGQSVHRRAVDRGRRAAVVDNQIIGCHRHRGAASVVVR